MAKKKRRKTPVSRKPPEYEEWEAFCREWGFLHIARKSYQYYVLGEWRDARGNEIYNWKQKLHSVWFDKDKNPPPPRKEPPPPRTHALYECRCTRTAYNLKIGEHSCPKCGAEMHEAGRS